VIDPAVDDLAEHLGVKRACDVLGRARGSHYRAKQPRARAAPGASGAAERAHP
jgi:putative transposase